MKRIFDIIFSFIGIIFLAPLFVIIAILIKLDSKGNVIYSSIRIGKNEKEFNFYKFRTMKPNSDAIAITIGEKDPRITNIGYFLRKYKLDELPQLINVLKGDISLVGPRADVKKYTIFYKKFLKEYYNMKPGITGYSSIYFSDEAKLYESAEDPESLYINEIIPKKVELDKKYYYQMNVCTDIKIIFKTIVKIIKN